MVQCVVYLFKCNLCDTGYVGYTKGHLYMHIESYSQKASSIYKYYCKEHNTITGINPKIFLVHFIVIRKCKNKFECLVNEMLCIQDHKPALNVQLYSLPTKVFK